MDRQASSICNKIVLYSVLFIFAAIVIFPIFWMFSSSIKTMAEAFKYPSTFIPRKTTFSPYFEVLESVPFGMFYLNSIKIAGLITIAQVITSSMAAYAFSRLRFPGREILFFVYLSSLMVPIQVRIIPIFILIKFLGLVDTHKALILPDLVNIFGIFLLRQFFMTIPYELEDAAKIDGASTFRRFYHIILPLSTPALATLVVFQFNFYWNEFFRPLIFLNHMEKFTLPLGLQALAELYGAGNPCLKLAAASMATIPVLFIFIMLQRFFRRGITLSGFK